jgi:hypothetical protein
MSSVVAAFTLRDLNRQPAKVLEAVRKFGSVEIRNRKGEVFTISRNLPKQTRTVADYVARFDALWKRQRELGLIPPPESENDRLDRIIAGEE